MEYLPIIIVALAIVGIIFYAMNKKKRGNTGGATRPGGPKKRQS